MLVSGSGDSAPMTGMLDRVSGRVINLGWERESPEGFPTVRIRLEGSERRFLFDPIELAQLEAVEDLVGHKGDLWVVAHDSNVKLTRVSRLETTLGVTDADDRPIIVYAHKGKEASTVSRVRWGAVMIVTAAVLLVVGRLADVWNRHRHEILGS